MTQWTLNSYLSEQNIDFILFIDWQIMTIRFLAKICFLQFISIEVMMSKRCLLTFLFQFKSKTYATFRHFLPVFRTQSNLSVQFDPFIFWNSRKLNYNVNGWHLDDCYPIKFALTLQVRMKTSHTVLCFKTN